MRTVAKSTIGRARAKNYSYIYCAEIFARRSMIVLFLSLVPLSHAFAQETRPSFFAGASFSSNISSASIPTYDGSYRCGVLNDGRKNEPGFFGGVTFPLSDKFSINTKFQYSNLSSSFEKAVDSTPLTPLAYRISDHSYVAITRNRLYDATLGLLSASGMISYALFPRLRISAGPFVGFLLTHSYQETEKIVSPSDAVYVENNRQIRSIGSDQVSNVNSLQYGIQLNGSYELPFQPHVGLRPSIGMSIPFTTIQSQSVWYIRTFSASIDLVYHLSEPPVREIPVASEIPVVVSPIPTPATSSPVPEERAMLRVSIKALGVEDDGREVSEPVLSIERTHVTEVYPMLHYVFFDDGSEDIPERYHRENAETRNDFNEKDLFTANALEIHHHVLDIIGKRLVEYPQGSVTLVGTRSEHSPKDSAQGSDVALGRARSVQDYLVTVWGISRERLHLRERGLPEAASDDHNPFGEAENRRVEIIPSSPDITAPLWTERIERVATPPRINFQPAITTTMPVGIRSATITVIQRGRTLRMIDALSDSAASEYIWTIDDRSMPDYASGRIDSLTYVFSAVDSLGDTASATGVIHLLQQARDLTKHASDTSLDKKLERFSLILFDYSSSQLDKKESDRIVRDMASSIQSQTRVTLTGHTDKTGDDAFNDRLARDRVTRAEQMLQADLRQIGKSNPAIAVESRGSRDELFDNSIPEGRVLSRTVRALIENRSK